MFPIQANILHRVFFIKAGKYGTAFTIDVEGAEYLVTAKHLFDQAADNHEIQLFQNNRWVPYKPNAIVFCRSEADIAVLRLYQKLTPPDLPVTPTVAGLILGQDVYILGFPHKMHEDVGQQLGGNPCPLIKRGTASSLGVGDPQVLFVDTLSNEGFSGGPVVFLSPSSPQGVRIAAVISGFKTHPEPVIGSDGEPTGAYVEMNTGLLRAYGIAYALDLISRMPR
ncbi:MAG: serine protease [Rhodanobacter sp.]|jgi:S1-C subfamily serine protease|uniref:S1 family peptidase n=1 Tax=Rhodanobacter sp. KK11 TaxID=3083255 RepID=UPI0029675B9A|nr:serine protease [Rhodanobacter sp. KK11]MDW2982555.1 serine protease [Rhodanobacter sp. KK11]